MQNKFLKILFLTVFSLLGAYIYAGKVFNDLQTKFGQSLTASNAMIVTSPDDFTELDSFSISFNKIHGFMFNFAQIPIDLWGNNNGSMINLYSAISAQELQNILQNGFEFILVARDSKNNIMLPSSGQAGIPFANIDHFKYYLFDNNKKLLKSDVIPKTSAATLQGSGALGSYTVEANLSGENAIYTPESGTTSPGSGVKTGYPIYIIFESEETIQEPEYVRILKLIRAAYQPDINSVVSVLELTRAAYLVENQASLSLPAYTTLDQLKSALKTAGLAKPSEKLVHCQEGDFNLPGWSTGGSGFNFNLNGSGTANGYAFVQDPWRKPIGNKEFPNNAFNSDYKGVATTALNQGTPAYQSLLSNMNSGPHKEPALAFVILGFDVNYNIISNIVSNPPTWFGLYAYDMQNNGKTTLLPGFPIAFNPDNYQDSGSYPFAKGATGSAIFTFNGLMALDAGETVQLPYPFVLKIKWVGQSPSSPQTGKTTPLQQLWVSPAESGQNFIEIQLFGSQSSNQSAIGKAIYNIIGTKASSNPTGLLLKVATAQDSAKQNYYGLIKAYTSSSKYFESIANGLLFTWPTGICQGCSPTVINTIPNGVTLTAVPNATTNLTTQDYQEAQSNVQHYTADANGKLYVNFKAG